MTTTAAAVPTVVDIAEIQEMYTCTFESTAHWRREKAAEFPDDVRNAQSADGLDALATWFRALPADHSLLYRLGVAANSPIVDPHDNSTGEEENRLISRFRFGTEEPFEAFIETLIKNLTVVDPLEAKRRESRLRRALTRDGYVLRKSRARNWRLDNQQGYMIVDPSMNIAIGHSDFSLNLDDVQRWLDGEVK
jgi:hypothetical protein